MADVFLSYMSHDRSTAAKIAGALEAAGLSVWWDRHIKPGVDFSAEIDRQLRAAKAAIVLWSSQSIDSAWVRDEAAYARDAHKLIPVCIDATPPPLGFRQIQSLDFSDAADSKPVVDELVAAVHQFLGRDPSSSPATLVPNARGSFARNKRRLIVIVAVAVIAGGVAAIVAWTDLPRTLSHADRVSGLVEIDDFDLLTEGDDAVRFAKGLTDAFERMLTTSDTQTVTRKRRSSGNDGEVSVQAEFAVRGTIDRVDDKFVINAAILHARDGLTIWSTSRERSVGEARDFQEEFSDWVATVLFCGMSRRTLYLANDPSTELFSKLLRYCAAEFDAANAAQELPELARQIVVEAPQYAFSHGICATSSALLTTLGPPREELERLRRVAYACAETSFSIDPDNSLGLAALAIVYDPARRIAERENLYQKILDVDPRFYYATLWYGNVLQNVGRTRDARVWLSRFVNDFRLAGPGQRSERDFVTAELGDLVGARHRFEDSVRIWPTDRSTRNQWFAAEHWFGDPAMARGLAAQASVDQKSMPCLNAFLDARSRAVQLSEHDIDTACATGFYFGNRPEWTYAYFGHVDAAFRALDAAAANYVDSSNRLATNSRPVGGLFWPAMRSVRADVRFMPFAARLGLAQYWLETDHWPDFCSTEELTYNCRDAAVAAVANAPKS